MTFKRNPATMPREYVVPGPPDVVDPDPWEPTGYGLLYNGAAVMDARDIAPEGWEVMTYAQLNILGEFVRHLEPYDDHAFTLHTNRTGQKLKSPRSAFGMYPGWNWPNPSDNISQLWYAGGGYRDIYGYWNDLGRVGLYWTKTVMSTFNLYVAPDFYDNFPGWHYEQPPLQPQVDYPFNSLYAYSVYTNNSVIAWRQFIPTGNRLIIYWPKSYWFLQHAGCPLMGKSVRCFAPKKHDENDWDTGTFEDIDGNTYHYIVLGQYRYMQENLKVTRYRNGDNIEELASTTPAGFASWVHSGLSKKGAYTYYAGISQFI